MCRQAADIQVEWESLEGGGSKPPPYAKYEQVAHGDARPQAQRKGAGSTPVLLSTVQRGVVAHLPTGEGNAGSIPACTSKGIDA